MNLTATTPASQPPALPHPAHGPTACLNCGHAVPGRYCGQCGQDAHHTHRLTMADMLHDIPHSIWHVDKGILFTLKTMIFRPGSTIRAYLAGQRVDHFRPLSLLLVVTGLYAFLSVVLHVSVLPPREPGIPDVVWNMQVITSNFLTKYLSWCYVAMVPVWALFARLFLRRGGFNYAECLIIAAFITAICNFFTLVLLPVSYFYNGTPQAVNVSYFIMAVSSLYATWAYGNMLKYSNLSRAGRLWRGFMAYALGYLTSITLLTVLTYVLNWNTFVAGMKHEKQLKQQSRSQPAPAASQPH